MNWFKDSVEFFSDIIKYIFQEGLLFLRSKFFTIESPETFYIQKAAKHHGKKFASFIIYFSKKNKKNL